MTTARASAFHIYPVKSLAGTALDELTVEPWGPAGDRRWMLTGPDGRQLTQREHPRLALACAGMLPASGPSGAGERGVRVAAPGREPLEVAVPPQGEATVTVRLFGREVEAVAAPAAANEWFSDYLETPARLVYLDAPEHRREIGAPARPGETVSFADGFPLLLTAVSSLNALNQLIAQGDHADEGPLPMSRFRPNVVVEGTAPWAEDDWRRIRIGEAVFRVVKPCGRCVVTTTDQATAERGKEPLRTLSRHRRFGDQLVFGQNLVPERTGRMRSGDSFEVLEP